MGFLRKVQSIFHDDWCQDCTAAMDLRKKQLFALPMTVGHYVEHDDPNYFLQNLTKVDKKADIPTGLYACGSYLYHCPKCNKEIVKLTIFLPVRDQEQVETSYLYSDPDLIKFIKNS